MSKILKLDNNKNLDAMERIATKVMSFRLAKAQDGATDLSKALVRGMAHVLDPKNYQDNPENNFMIRKLKRFSDTYQGDKQNILLEIAKITRQFNLADFSKEDLKNFSIDIAEAISSELVVTTNKHHMIPAIKDAYQ